jgi:bifunctional non-homologous end joining protein LigD
MAGQRSILAPARAPRVRPRRSPSRPAVAAAADPMPAHIDPMLALLSARLPHDGTDWAFEYKWDGVRAIAFADGPKSWRIESRNLLDITRRYPELLDLHESLGKRSAILDGEIVALDDLDRPSFPRLQKRMHVNDAAQIARLVKQVPILYVLFDVLYLDGRSLLDRTYSERRQILEELTLAGPSWTVTPSYVNHGQQMLDAATQNKLEGIVAKKLDSTYELGRRSNCWLKIKIVGRQEFVIAGWTRESTGLADRIGTMLIGYYDCHGKLHYAGHVGTGLVGSDHPILVRQFEKVARPTNPFVEKLPAARRGGQTIQFLEPRLVAEVEFRRWPDGGLVQQAAFKGIRKDKDARAVVKEVPSAQ